ncbi:MAG: hypothetical protein K2J06_03455, partial [Muribaculaceae bacterium]|nr:hypothetical protein [Muribaculaceae bacterium]
MARTKISKVAKDLNVALGTVTDFLRSKNIEVDDNPNTRIEDDVVDMLMSHFSSDINAKRRAEQFSSARQKEKEVAKPEAPKVAAPEQPEEVETPGAPAISGPKILGHIQLDKHGNPVKAS